MTSTNPNALFDSDDDTSSDSDDDILATSTRAGGIRVKILATVLHSYTYCTDHHLYNIYHLVLNVMLLS